MGQVLSMKIPELRPIETNVLTEEFKLVQKLWLEKKSMKEIAEEIGKSRSAVAGLIYRGRKCGMLKDRPTKAGPINRHGGRTPKELRVIPVKAIEPPPPAPPKPAPRIAPAYKPNPPFRAVTLPVPAKPQRVRLNLVDNPTAVTFEELKSHHCRWPTGDPKQRDFRFCGRQRLTVGPYCETHAIEAVDPRLRKKKT